ncbi:hypothetical protein [Arthrobacter sp. B0490]|uniref:hypothetical protein n=1 Tax=Arthrobacter sp. B0490 TaxID=2058891 RepID=UPI0011AFF361|nr:hypothetical protein [Arthrobacter sp. B0490]
MRTISLLSIALAAAVGLSGCVGSSAGPDAGASDTTSAPASPAGSASAAATGSATASASASASASATPAPVTPPQTSASPAPVTPAPTSAAPSPAATPGATPAAGPDIGPSLPHPALQLLTTTDGLYSFMMPADWTATPVEPTTAPDYGAGLSRTAYSIRTAAGVEMAAFAGGVPGDGAALPSPGHVLLDSEELPGLSQQLEKVDLPVNYVFDYHPDPVTGATVYLARLHVGPLPADGTYGAPLGLVPLGSNGLVAFTSTFDSTRFADPEAARAWMASEEYAAVQGMFATLTFNG